MKKANVPLLKSSIRASNAIATGSLHSCPAVSLPGAYAIKEDYLKVVRSIMRSISKGPSESRPDLDILGLDANGTDMKLNLNQNIGGLNL